MKRDNAQKLTVDKCFRAFCNICCSWWRQDMAAFLQWCVHSNVNEKTKCQLTHCTPSAVRSNTPYKSVIKSNSAVVLSDRDNDDGWNTTILLFPVSHSTSVPTARFPVSIDLFISQPITQFASLNACQRNSMYVVLRLNHAGRTRIHSFTCFPIGCYHTANCKQLGSLVLKGQRNTSKR